MNISLVFDIQFIILLFRGLYKFLFILYVFFVLIYKFVYLFFFVEFYIYVQVYCFQSYFDRRKIRLFRKSFEYKMSFDIIEISIQVTVVFYWISNIYSFNICLDQI